MALKAPLQFPIFAPSHHHHRVAATEVRFSRWNNANAEKFNQQRRTQKEIEDQLRFQKRHHSAHNIAFNYNPAPPTPTFKSTGTPSTPSPPSIPGTKSKYSKNSKPPTQHHPAFKPIFQSKKVRLRKFNPNDSDEGSENNSDAVGQSKSVANVKIDDKGVSYEFPNAPFVYQYSYTETPRAKPLGLREPLVAPFEPATMGRPWTGRKPLPPSKKKLPEFDSFQLPPPHKKGVKPVQSPGPYLPGTGPKYVRSREEILGEPLTKEEIKALVESCKKSMRQLNMGRDGLTHNMLDNIHAHWKRRRVCKIKCKGVCTVDMDNVRQQLEEKTGGKVIYSRGGVIYLFRGRNYNYKTQPHFPLMLWRPVTPVYPRLIKRVPEGLTLEAASEMRKKGRNLTPICKLGKNGVYCDLAKNVREAFEACELVRINCQGLNGSDYRKIGAKLQDLVPCVLMSFEYEHILMWRGQDWKSSLPELKTDTNEEFETDTAANGPIAEDLAQSLTASASSVSNMTTSSMFENHSTSTSFSGAEDEESKGSKEHKNEGVGNLMDSESLAAAQDAHESERSPSHVVDIEPPSDIGFIVDSESSIDVDVNESKKERDDSNFCINDKSNMSPEAWQGSTGNDDNDVEQELEPAISLTFNNLHDASENATQISELASIITPSTEGVLCLLKQAVESGSAVVLDDSSLDADIVYEKAVALAKTAPPGPVFRPRPKKLATEECNKQHDDLEVKEAIEATGKEISVPSRRGSKKISKNRSMKEIRADYLNVAPKGSLGVDELAKLLA